MKNFCLIALRFMQGPSIQETFGPFDSRTEAEEYSKANPLYQGWYEIWELKDADAS